MSAQGINSSQRCSDPKEIALNKSLWPLTKIFKHQNGPKLKQLQNIVFIKEDFNFVQLLEEIAAEQEFEVTYIDIEENGCSNESRCLVKLSTVTPREHICSGTGANPEKARVAAAQKAFQYLRIISKVKKEM